MFFFSASPPIPEPWVPCSPSTPYFASFSPSSPISPQFLVFFYVMDFLHTPIFSPSSSCSDIFYSVINLHSLVLSWVLCRGSLLTCWNHPESRGWWLARPGFTWRTSPPYPAEPLSPAMSAPSACWLSVTPSSFQVWHNNIAHTLEILRSLFNSFLR